MMEGEVKQTYHKPETFSNLARAWMTEKHEELVKMPYSFAKNKKKVANWLKELELDLENLLEWEVEGGEED